MEFQYKFSLPAVNEEEILSFEGKSGLALPKDYKAFLLKNNGGQPTVDVLLSVPGFDEEDALSEFFGLGQKTKGLASSIPRMYEILKDRIPFGFLPIGGDGSGNTILLATATSGTSGVYFFDHENEPEDNKLPWNKFGNIYKLANNFTSFLSNLRPFEEDNE